MRACTPARLRLALLFMMRVDWDEYSPVTLKPEKSGGTRRNGISASPSSITERVYENVSPFATSPLLAFAVTESCQGCVACAACAPSARTGTASAKAKNKMNSFFFKFFKNALFRRGRPPRFSLSPRPRYPSLWSRFLWPAPRTRPVSGAVPPARPCRSARLSFPHPRSSAG